MFLHMAVVRIFPQKVPEAARVLINAQNMGCNQKAMGLRQAFLLESLEEPGRVIWLTTWNLASEAQAFLTSPEYAVLLARVRPYQQSGPEWYSFRVLGEMEGIEQGGFGDRLAEEGGGKENQL